MTDIILGIGVAAFIVYTGFQISYIQSIRRTSERMGDFFQNTEGNLNAALAELLPRSRSSPDRGSTSGCTH